MNYDLIDISTPGQLPQRLMIWHKFPDNNKATIETFQRLPVCYTYQF